MSRKPTLTEQLAACNEAYLNWKTEAAMAEAYYLQLQEHLREARDAALAEAEAAVRGLKFTVMKGAIDGEAFRHEFVTTEAALAAIAALRSGGAG